MRNQPSDKPKKHKPDKNYTPIDRHRQKIGEFHNKVTDKAEKAEPGKMNSIEINEGTHIIKVFFAVALLCLVLLALSLFYSSNN
ncbi:hypothetical protein SteCoe_22895 [Stentor coeruleus]|uniref:Uncharacterized protein n=1 Tax=Stentor coeruleus TaxID=5963 RepID=A0A1R2BL73_9CILI|nr:hypothetical protein SteCoe_22895 [Stentor coeruleus]